MLPSLLASNSISLFMVEWGRSRLLKTWAEPGLVCVVWTSRVLTTQTSPGSAQVFKSLDLAHSSVDAKNLGSA